jgi:hypothetical protein
MSNSEETVSCNIFNCHYKETIQDIEDRMDDNDNDIIFKYLDNTSKKYIFSSKVVQSTLRYTVVSKKCYEYNINLLLIYENNYNDQKERERVLDNGILFYNNEKINIIDFQIDMDNFNGICTVPLEII